MIGIDCIVCHLLEDIGVGRVGCDVRGRILRDGLILARQLNKRKKSASLIHVNRTVGIAYALVGCLAGHDG